MTDMQLLKDLSRKCADDVRDTLRRSIALHGDMTIAARSCQEAAYVCLQHLLGTLMHGGIGGPAARALVLEVVQKWIEANAAAMDAGYAAAVSSTPVRASSSASSPP